MSTTYTSPRQRQSNAPAGNRLGFALLVIATAQLMLVLDDSIANVALPTIQNELGISPASLPWVINAYILAFGGLLLFGGRAGDLFGRRRVFQFGLALFTLASLLVGLAPTGRLLIAARALQGIGAAITAPNALALIATTLPEGKARNNAVAVYGAMSALGIVLGLLVGGVLTDTLGWRWVFFINVPVGLLVLAGTRTLVDAARHTGRLDITGAITGTGGMAALVYAITRGGEHGWTDGLTLGLFAVALVLLPLFILMQARTADPLLPLHLFRDRNRAGSYLSMLLLGFGPMGTFYLVTLYMQHILQYSPIRTGLAWLPFAAGIVVGAGGGSKLVDRFGPRVVVTAGGLIASAGVLWLSTIESVTNYAGHIAPGMFAIALGFGLGAVSLTITAVHGIRSEEFGIASAILNAAQQIGVALGLAILSTVSVSVTEGRLPDALTALYRGRESGEGSLVTTASEALVNGYSGGLLAGAGALLVAANIAVVTITSGRIRSDDEAETEGGHCTGG